MPYMWKVNPYTLTTQKIDIPTSDGIERFPTLGMHGPPMVSVPVRKRIRSIGKGKVPVVGSRDIRFSVMT